MTISDPHLETGHVTGFTFIFGGETKISFWNLPPFSMPYSYNMLQDVITLSSYNWRFFNLI